MENPHAPVWVLTKKLCRRLETGAARNQRNQMQTDERTENAKTVGTSGLLGCPWCGEEPEYQPAAQSVAHPQYGWPHMLVHNCKVYGAQICFRTDTMKVEDTKEALFAAWNTRKQPNK